MPDSAPTVGSLFSGALPGSSTAGCTSQDSSTPGSVNPTLGGEICSPSGSPEPSSTTTSAPCGVKLLPTPTKGDSRNSRSSTAPARKEGSAFNPGVTLSDVAHEWAQQAGSISSPGASLAAEPRAPASARASTTPKPFCGTRCDASSVSFDPAIALSKTSRIYWAWRRAQWSLLEASGPLWWGTWPRSGMTRSGIVYPLVPSAPRTSVTGSLPLLLPPRVSDQNGAGIHGTGGQDLRTVVHMLPTPTRSEGTTGRGSRGAGSVENGGGQTLRGSLNLLPTPRARVDKEHGPDGKHWGELRPIVESLSNGATTSPPSTDGKPSTGLRLNPSFVEWMMGAPTCAECGRGWTDPECEHSASDFRL